MASIVAMSMIMAVPANAQSRKDKKAAEKAQWELQQQQQKEEAELRHQMKMDSLRNAQQAQNAAAAKAQADQAKREKDAERRAAEQEQLRREQATTDMPCQIFDDAEWFTATASRRFKGSNANTVVTALLRSAKQQLLQKLQGKYQQVADDYFDQMDVEEGAYERSHIESAGRMVMQQMVNETYETCRKVSAYADAEGYKTMYMAIKISKKELLEKTVNEISKEEEMRVRFNEKQFRDSAFKVFEEDNKKAYDEFQQQ